MKNRIFILNLMAAAMISTAFAPAALGADSAQPAKAAGYNPSLTYPGSYVPTTLYIRHSRLGPWKRGFSRQYPKGISCRDALNSFGRSGLWNGHLKPDGSCGTLGEPTEWALGNRLNFGPVSVPAAGE